jgi:hypothetical protein
MHLGYWLKSWEKRSLGRPRYKWTDDIKMHLRVVVWDMNWIELARDRERWRALLNTVVNLRVPKKC